MCVNDTRYTGLNAYESYIYGNVALVRRFFDALKKEIVVAKAGKTAGFCIWCQ